MMNLKIMSFCFFAAVPFCGQAINSRYQDYCVHLKSKAGIEITFPSEKVEINDKEEFAFFTFGTAYENIPGLPMFNVGPEVAVSQFCTVYLMDKHDVSSLPANGKYDIPYSTSWMLNNCGAAWARWFVNNAGGVISENMKYLSKEEQDKMKKEINELRSANEKCLENNSLTDRAGCDRIYVVTIPNVGKINLCIDSPTNHHPFCKLLQTDSLECCAVELYKGSKSSCMRILLFLDGGRTSIDECLSEIVEHINFR